MKDEEQTFIVTLNGLATRVVVHVIIPTNTARVQCVGGWLSAIAYLLPTNCRYCIELQPFTAFSHYGSANDSLYISN
jgi:hypothetical protein